MSQILPDIKQIEEWLSYPKDVVILTHRNPDGDALGSSLAMRHFLEKFSHSVKVIIPSEYPTNFSWMPGLDDALIYDLNQEDCLAALEKAEWLISLDFNGLDRIDKLGKHIEKHSDKPSLLIDHHIDPEPFTDEVYSDTEASSTCEMLYKFIGMLDEVGKIDQTIAECLFTGIITDTGRFRHSTNKDVYKIAGDLKDLGIRDERVNDYIFNSYTEKQLRLLGYCLYKRLEVLEEFDTAIISLTREDYKRFNIQRGDTEGIVNYMMMMPHIRLAAFITEQPTIVKLSLRSKGDVSVQEIARNHFKGGGHKNAAGGSMRTSLSKAIKTFKSVIPPYVKKTLTTK
jgi:phosphoesterase RecJ-like protein